MSLFEFPDSLFTRKDGSKAGTSSKRPDPQKLVMPPTKFRQIGNCIVRPEKVQAISLDYEKHELSIALECGESWFFATDERRFNDAIEQIKAIFNIDIQEPK